MTRTPLLLFVFTLTACGDKSEDSAATDDTASATDATDAADGTDGGEDGASGLPDELGFELDGSWYPQTAGNSNCSDYGDRYWVTQGGAREEDGSGANVYVLFVGGSRPAPGTYRVNQADGYSPPAEGEATMWFNDNRDTSAYWYSAGTGGTVTVSDAGGGALDVAWQNVDLVRGEGSVIY